MKTTFSYSVTYFLIALAIILFVAMISSCSDNPVEIKTQTKYITEIQVVAEWTDALGVHNYSGAMNGGVYDAGFIHLWNASDTIYVMLDSNTTLLLNPVFDNE